MTRRIVLGLGPMLLASIFFTATAAFAAPAPEDSDFSMQGKITEKSAGKLTISSGDNIIFHIVFNDTTVVNKKDGSAGTAEDLKIGVMIVVTGSLAENGEITATKISIEDDSGKP